MISNRCPIYLVFFIGPKPIFFFLFFVFLFVCQSTGGLSSSCPQNILHPFGLFIRRSADENIVLPLDLLVEKYNFQHHLWIKLHDKMIKQQLTLLGMNGRSVSSEKFFGGLIPNSTPPHGCLVKKTKRSWSVFAWPVSLCQFVKICESKANCEELFLLSYKSSV